MIFEPTLRLVASGADVHHDVVSGQGTVGGWLVHPPSGQRFGFGNCHVVAALGRAAMGAPLYQHGHNVGALQAYITLDQRYYNTTDVALFSVDPRTQLHWAHPAPVGNVEPNVGMRVYKHGATTGLTTGVIIGTGGKRRMLLGGLPFWFDDIVTIKGSDLPFSAIGDSGALVMATDEQCATAILFGKHPTKDEAYAFPISAAAPLFAGLHYSV